MASLTSDRYLKELKNGFQGHNYGTAANAQFWYGQLVGLGTDDGTIKPMTGSANIKCVGVSLQSNWLVSPTNPLPLPYVQYAYGCFDFQGDGTITADTAPGTLLYFSDDQTVSTHTGSFSQVVGRLVTYQSGLQYPVFAEVGPLTSPGATV